MADDDRFLSRWSRRKAQARVEADVPEAAPEVVPDVVPDVSPVVDDRVAIEATEGGDVTEAAQTLEVPGPPDSRSAPDASEVAPAAPLPTLEDVERLTPDADFSPFVDRMLNPEVRNAAMKKLFTDPHFNVMDGLDVYIDDYNKADPLPKQWLRQIVQARVLGLLDDELEEQPRPTPGAVPLADADVSVIDDDRAAAATPTDNPILHEDPDLPLQSNDAAGLDSPRAATDDGDDDSRG